MNALAILDEQHRTIEALFAKLEDEMLPSVRRHRFLQLATAMHLHAMAEQKIFFPAMKARATEEILMESLAKHHDLEARITELLTMPPAQERYRERLHALRLQFEHHVKEQQA